MHVPIAISRVDYFGFGSFDFFDVSPRETDRTAGPGAYETKLREKRHACTEGVQRLGSRRAVDLDCDQDSARNHHLTASGSESFRHTICSFALRSGSQEQRLDDSHSSQSEETRGDSPRPVPSDMNQNPDFRDLARFEWRFR